MAFDRGDPRADGREDPQPEDERGTIPPTEEGSDQEPEPADGETQQPLGDSVSDEESLRYKQLERDREQDGGPGQREEN